MGLQPGKGSHAPVHRLAGRTGSGFQCYDHCLGFQDILILPLRYPVAEYHICASCLKKGGGIAGPCEIICHTS